MIFFLTQQWMQTEINRSMYGVPPALVNCIVAYNAYVKHLREGLEKKHSSLIQEERKAEPKEEIPCAADARTTQICEDPSILLRAFRALSCSSPCAWLHWDYTASAYSHKAHNHISSFSTSSVCSSCNYFTNATVTKQALSRWHDETWGMLFVHSFLLALNFFQLTVTSTHKYYEVMQCTHPHNIKYASKPNAIKYVGHTRYQFKCSPARGEEEDPGVATPYSIKVPKSPLYKSKHIMN